MNMLCREPSYFILIKRAAKAFFLAMCLASCQTFAPSEEQQNHDSLIATRVALVQSQMDQGKPELAIQNLKSMLQETPDEPLLLNMVGLGYLALSNFEEAKRYFSQALSLKSDPSISLNYSSALIASGDMGKAREILNQALKDGKGYAFRERLYHNIALAWEKDRQYKRAEQNYRMALTENPAFYLSNINLGGLYKKMKRRNDAVKALTSAVNFCKTCYEAVSDLAYLHLEAQAPEQAMAVVEGFLKSKDISAENRSQATALLQLARAQERQKNAIQKGSR